MRNDRPLAIAFGDLRGFTTYTAKRGDAEALRVAERFASVVRSELEEHGGRLVKTYGDGVMLSFEDPSPAVRSVVDAQRALSAYNDAHPDESLCAGFGLTWGPAIRTGEDLFGHSVNLAKRLADIAKACQIVASAEIRDETLTTGFAFRDMGEREIKGIGSSRLYEIVWRDEAAVLALPDDSLDVVLTNDRRLILEFAKPVDQALEAIRTRLDAAPKKGPNSFLKRKMVERLARDLPKWADAMQRYGNVGIEHRLDEIDASFTDGKLRIQLPNGRTLAFARNQIKPDDAHRFLAKLVSLREQKKAQGPSGPEPAPRG